MNLDDGIPSASQLLREIGIIVETLDDLQMQIAINHNLTLLKALVDNPMFQSRATITELFRVLNSQLHQHPYSSGMDFNNTTLEESLVNTQNLHQQSGPSTSVSAGSSQMRSLNASNKVLNKQVLLPPQTIQVRRLEDDSISESFSAVNDAFKTAYDTLSSTEWAQVEAIELVDDGTKLGLGRLRMDSMGVVIKTIVPGGVADRDGRLQSGDYILQISGVNLHNMGPKQVERLLQQCGRYVKLVVARPSCLSFSIFGYKYLSPSAAEVPVKLLSNPDELDRYLTKNQYLPVFRSNDDYQNARAFDEPQHDCVIPSSSDVPYQPSYTTLHSLNEVPEMKTFIVELKSNPTGLGITIIRHLCGIKLSGIFIIRIRKGGVADLNGKIQVNDRIVEINGISLQEQMSYRDVRMLLGIGNTVKLCLKRYFYKPKYVHMQQAILDSKLISSTPEPRFLLTQEELHRRTVENQQKRFRMSDLTPAVEAEIKNQWLKKVSPGAEIVVAQFTKFWDQGDLGISVEEIVEMKNGHEIPHHYIGVIVPELPVGRYGNLKSGDELLEVNGEILLGKDCFEVICILRELPLTVRMVCGRNSSNFLYEL